MKRVCYMSRARLNLGMAERDAMLRTSIRNNEAASITGLLLCDGHRFLQALEGNDTAIERCWSRIRQDDRHFDLVVFEEAQITTREFGAWAMTCRSALVINPTSFRAEVLEDIASVTNLKLKAMFIGFASLAR